MDFFPDPIAFLANWLTTWLSGFLPAAVAEFLVLFIGVVIVGSFGLVLTIFLIWVERKVAGRFQDRLGPNRVGPWGIFQTFADIVKIFTKEDATPAGADKPVYNMAPLLSVSAVILIWAVVPFAKPWFGSDINVGVLYIVAVGALGVLAVIMAGWSSNNKYALLGAFRAVSQMVSYEVPMVLTLLVPVLLARTMGVSGIVESQDSFFGMMFWMAPLAAVLFFVSSIAEIGRTPFDLLEAESEIVAGFHIEYSGLKFGMFYVGEFFHAFTIAAMTAILFFGGWQGPGADTYPLLGFVYFMGKSFLLYFTVIWIRMTLPRLRIDHMLSFNWKFLTPLALALLVVTSILNAVLYTYDVTPLVRTFVLFAGNVVLGWLAFGLLGEYIQTNRPVRKVVGLPRPVARPPEATVSQEGD